MQSTVNMRGPFHSRSITFILLLLVWVSLFSSCGSRGIDNRSIIEFTKVPGAADGGPDGLDTIEGRVLSAKPGQRIVLYAKSVDIWWVQPFAAKPFTEMQSNSSWRNVTHLGEEYAALLVESSYVPLPKTTALPREGGPVQSVKIAAGTPRAEKIIHFSGYEWEASPFPSSRGGKVNAYDPANVWTDANGFLHLRIARRGNAWSCSEVKLTESLGQGSYAFTVRDVSRLDPAAVMTLYTWDLSDRFHRELDVEVSRWGNSASKNAQYVIQPYWEPSNVARFEAPPGRVRFSFDWEPGKVSFRTSRGDIDSRSRLVAEHIFTSGVPSSGSETVHINLYAFGNTPVSMRGGGEVVVEKFEYLP